MLLAWAWEHHPPSRLAERQSVYSLDAVCGVGTGTLPCES